jgi:mannose-1-phosphate guanylyltransferase
LQAIILVGGEGTRLRPLTSGIPKPIVTFVDRPFMAYMLQWLHAHGVDDVIMACGFLPDAVEAALGDGSQYGVKLRYLQEPEPRGTAGALKFAEEFLQERFLMLNGDVLTDVDITAQLEQHERTGATGTLGLVPVDDPSAYGLVLTQPDDGAVTGFLEKPGPDQLAGVDEYLISAGIYVLEHSVLGLIEPDVNVSIEHTIWPALVGDGLYGYAARDAYWLDIGTPQRYLQGTADILAGNVRTGVQDRLGDGVAIAGSADGATIPPPVIIEAGATVAAGATIGPATVIGAGASVGAGAVVERSVVLDGGVIGEGATVRDAILAPRVRVGARTVLEDQVVLGEGAVVGADNVLSRGLKLFPGATIADGAIRF